LKLNGR
jgi:hypothetical protein